MALDYGAGGREFKPRRFQKKTFLIQWNGLTIRFDRGDECIERIKAT